MSTSKSNRSKSELAALSLAALGVVYGDIGTSPLYALREIFHSGHFPATSENILGILSLIFWTITVIVSLKYVVLILRADNGGEGGLIAMMALATNAVSDKPKLRRVLLLVGIFGTAIFYGDGVITPVITVMGAMEGLKVVSPAFEGAVIPLTLVVITALFAVQRHGTASMGRAFGPVTLLWFAVLIAMGVPWIYDNPAILAGLNPMHAFNFFMMHKMATFIGLGAVVLVVTGGEALYADLGHFGRLPIRLAWYVVVLPALVINYFGQGAMLLKHPETLANPFYMMAPIWATLPLVFLATAASVIASQALITAAFSVTKQAIQMGLLPRMSVLHTNVKETGQIYVPAVNWTLFGLVVVAVVLFGSSSKIAAAYGIAVTMDMTITTIMTFFVIRYGWKLPLPLCLISTGIFFAIDFTFFASNMLKLLGGGWFPLLIGSVVFMLMVTWKQGRRILSEALRHDAIELKGFLDAVFLSPPVRVAGSAVFLSAERGVTPNALLHNLKHNKVLHEQNLFVNVKHHEVPWVGFDQRVQVESLGRDCWQVQLNFGFKNEPDVPEALKLLEQHGVQMDDMETSYFISRDIIMPTVGSGMAMWREKLFASMHRNASGVADFLNLPTNRVVELGSKVEI